MGRPTIEQLRERVRGEVITAHDEGYEQARKVFNAMIDRRPRVVVRCANAGDVMAAVDFSRENQLDLAVRGGGHSVPGFGTCDDGVVVDLSRMRGVRVDPKARTARAEGGATWGDFNHATHAFGLATTGGVVSTTGIGGLTLGGGIGYLARGFGLSCDNLVSADVVTADGRFLVASEDENDDLFWALRGGGGNFGVATTFEYRLHPLTEVTAGLVAYPFDAARDVLRFFRDFTRGSLSDDLMVVGALVHAPDGSGAKLAAMVVCHTG
ncbi:MAG: FAD-binding oxidoreductase, partial [Acidimicrobiia bacterium]